jgi:IS605 OrfB family transposase
MKVNKTILLKISEPNKEKLNSLIRIINIYKELICFYLLVIYNYQKFKIYSLSKKSALSYLEKITISTKAHPNPLFPLINQSKYQTNIRRSAINKAVGMLKSYVSNLLNYYKEKQEYRGKKVGYPEPKNFSLTYYATDISLKDIKDGFVSLKVINEKGDYEFKNYPVCVYKRFTDYYSKSDWQMKKTGTLIKRGEDFYIAIVFEKEVKKPDMKEIKTIIGIDLNIKRNVFSASAIDRESFQIKKVYFGNGVFNHLINKRNYYRDLIHFKIKQTGGSSRNRGKNFCKVLWEKVREINNEISHLASRRIIEFSKEFESPVIVFEKIKYFNADKTKYSKKHNERLNYWLKNSIVNFTEYKSNYEGIRKRSVYPKDTSRVCLNKYCRSLNTERFSEGDVKRTTLLRCLDCGYVANADFVGSVNVGLKFIVDIFYNGNAFCGEADGLSEDNLQLVFA